MSYIEHTRANAAYTAYYMRRMSSRLFFVWVLYVLRRVEGFEQTRANAQTETGNDISISTIKPNLFA